MTEKRRAPEAERQTERVERALFRAATGYKMKIRKPVKVKEETNRPGEGKQVIERVVTVEEQVYVEPKITAQMFWLKSRKPEIWGGKALREAGEELVPVMEAYADMLEHPARDRTLEEITDEGPDTVCPAD